MDSVNWREAFKALYTRKITPDTTWKVIPVPGATYRDDGWFRGERSFFNSYDEEIIYLDGTWKKEVWKPTPPDPVPSFEGVLGPYIPVSSVTRIPSFGREEWYLVRNNEFSIKLLVNPARKKSKIIHSEWCIPNYIYKGMHCIFGERTLYYKNYLLGNYDMVDLLWCKDLEADASFSFSFPGKKFVAGLWSHGKPWILFANYRTRDMSLATPE